MSVPFRHRPVGQGCISPLCAIHTREGCFHLIYATHKKANCGILRDAADARGTSNRKGGEHEVRLLGGANYATEANDTPRSVARFSHAGRQRLPGATFSRGAYARL